MLNTRRVILVLAVHAALVTPIFAVSGLPSLTTSEPMFMRYNGLALDIRSAVVPLPRESLANAILDAWRATGAEGLRFDSDGDRVVLGRQSGPLHETLSLLRTEDPLSTAVIRALQDSRQSISKAPPLPFTLPAGLKIIDTVEDYSGRHSSIMYRIDSELLARDAIEKLRVAILDARWEISARYLSDRGPSSITAAREAEKLVVTATDEDRVTRVLVHLDRRTP